METRQKEDKSVRIIGVIRDEVKEKKPLMTTRSSPRINFDVLDKSSTSESDLKTETDWKYFVGFTVISWDYDVVGKHDEAAASEIDLCSSI